MKNKRKEHKVRENGTVYLLEIVLGDDLVYKVGATANSARHRALQLIEGMESVYGYFPMVRILKEERCLNYYQVEKRIHKQLSEYGYVSCKTFVGHTEVFQCEYEAVLRAYNTELFNSNDIVESEGLLEW